MARERRQFSAEYKREAVRLVEAGRSVLDVARSLGVRADMLRKWRRQVTESPDIAEAFPGHGKLASQDEEVRRLRREVAILREEREVLKKATAFFARESR